MGKLKLKIGRLQNDLWEETEIASTVEPEKVKLKLNIGRLQNDLWEQTDITSTLESEKTKLKLNIGRLQNELWEQTEITSTLVRENKTETNKNVYPRISCESRRNQTCSTKVRRDRAAMERSQR